MITITRKFAKHAGKSILTAYGTGTTPSTHGVCIHIASQCGYTGYTTAEMSLTKEEAARLIQELQALVAR